MVRDLGWLDVRLVETFGSGASLTFNPHFTRRRPPGVARSSLFNLSAVKRSHAEGYFSPACPGQLPVTTVHLCRTGTTRPDTWVRLARTLGGRVPISYKGGQGR